MFYQLLTWGRQQLCKKMPLWGIAVFSKNVLFCITKLKPATMKLLSESIRSFFEGFLSFYTSIFDEMKTW